MRISDWSSDVCSSDLVGEHPVLAELEHLVAGHVAELAHRVEHVDGEPLERTVHPGEPQDRIRVAGRLVEEGVLGELADVGAHVVAELDGDLAVASLVPALAALGGAVCRERGVKYGKN